MLYVDFKAGEKEYKLRLNTRAIVELEEALGLNPILVFKNEANNNSPTTKQMVLILHAALQNYHPEISIDETYNIFDDYLADNHIVGEFAGVIVKLYKLSGLFKNEKN